MTRIAASRNVYLATIFPLGFFVTMIAIGLTSAGGVLNLIYAPIAAALALLLLLLQPTAYLSFVMWAWMLTPLVRRLNDLHGGYHEVSVVMVAPLAATAIAVLTPLRFRDRLTKRGLAPYVFYLFILVFGFFVGALSAGISAAALALANWAVPVIFAIHLLVSPEAPEDKARAMLRALLFGSIVIGTYGVFQYVLLPEWDANWMIASKLQSIGRPEPFEVRVFGPLNSSGPYAAFTAAGVIVSFSTRSNARVTAMATGLIGLLLSLVRAVWGAWILSIALIFFWSPVRTKLRILTFGTIAAVLVVPALLATPLGDNVTKRFDSIGNGESDRSLIERQALYLEFSNRITNSITGVGLGQTGIISTRLSGQSDSDATSIDSGLLEAFYTFGILASVLFGAILFMFAKAWPRRGDDFAIASMAVAASGIPILIFGNPLIGATGMLIFPFMALARHMRDYSLTPLSFPRDPPPIIADHAVMKQ